MTENQAPAEQSAECFFKGFLKNVRSDGIDRRRIFQIARSQSVGDLKAHHYRLATELKSINVTLDLSSSIRQLDKEIEVIEEGLAKLNGNNAAAA